MDIRITFRKTCLGDMFYELYVNGVRLCGFYNLIVIFIRLRKWLNKNSNFYELDDYERILLNG